MGLRVYIGHELREQAAYDVAAETARSFGCEAIPLYEERLRYNGILTRPKDTRGQMWDINSAAPQSTSFAIARFAVPMLAHSGWALFVDCDVVFMRDPHELLKLADPRYAVMVVKHSHYPDEHVKMDNQQQTRYARKNWSSVALWNCDHLSNRRLNLQMLNQWPGRDLHGFYWLDDSEIGELPPEWNWLVDVQDKPVDPAIAHFTLGTPDMPGHEGSQHADIWHSKVSQR